MELESLPLAEGWIEDYFYFVQVTRIYKVAGVGVSLGFEAIVEGQLDFLTHLEWLLQGFLGLRDVGTTEVGFLVFLISLSLFGNQINDLNFLFELLALMRIFVIGTTSASIGESDVEELSFYLFLLLKWFLSLSLYCKMYSDWWLSLRLVPLVRRRFSFHSFPVYDRLRFVCLLGIRQGASLKLRLYHLLDLSPLFLLQVISLWIWVRVYIFLILASFLYFLHYLLYILLL